MSTIRIDPKDISVADLHGYLLAAVAPRPIAFASTINEQGAVNLSPFSFFNVFSANPPIMIFSPAKRGRDNTYKHTYENAKSIPEVVINIVNHPMVEQMSLASTEYAQGVNEFIKSGLTAIPSELVKPPRVKESPVSFECTVDQVIELGQDGGAGNLVISRVQLIHVQSQYMDQNAKLDTTKIDLVARMGGDWYCRASGDALFEIPKPVFNKGIGVDALPESIRHSTILTGNNLGRLGNLQALPDEKTIMEVKMNPEISKMLKQYQDNPTERVQAFHLIAQKHLENQSTEMALRILMLADKL